MQVYEPGGLLTDIRNRVTEFMGRHNEEFPAKKVPCAEHQMRTLRRTKASAFPCRRNIFVLTLSAVSL